MWNSCRDSGGKLAELLLPSSKDDGEYSDLFELFACTLCAPNVVGQTVWKKRKVNDLYSEIVTMADESFALLLLENNFDVWIKYVQDVENVLINGREVQDEDNDANEYDNREDSQDMDDLSTVTNSNSGSSEELASQSKYTRSKGNGVGWNEEGLIRFGEIMRIVIESRKKMNRNGRKRWEEKIKEKCNHVGRVVPIGNGVGLPSNEGTGGDTRASVEDNARSALMVAFNYSNGTAV